MMADENHVALGILVVMVLLLLGILGAWIYGYVACWIETRAWKKRIEDEKLRDAARKGRTMTQEDWLLTTAFADAIRHSAQGKRLVDQASAHELAVIAHHAIKDRLPRDTR